MKTTLAFLLLSGPLGPLLMAHPGLEDTNEEYVRYATARGVETSSALLREEGSPALLALQGLKDSWSSSWTYARMAAPFLGDVLGDVSRHPVQACRRVPAFFRKLVQYSVECSVDAVLKEVSG